jgi:hypothetical protein
MPKMKASLVTGLLAAGGSFVYSSLKSMYRRDTLVDTRPASMTEVGLPDLLAGYRAYAVNSMSTKRMMARLAQPFCETTVIKPTKFYKHDCAIDVRPADNTGAKLWEHSPVFVLAEVENFGNKTPLLYNRTLALIVWSKIQGKSEADAAAIVAKSKTSVHYLNVPDELVALATQGTYYMVDILEHHSRTQAMLLESTLPLGVRKQDF